jgi:glyoxylase-like metal-dependent hydrolase (beta-lactamase superfamily II)
MEPKDIHQAIRPHISVIGDQSHPLYIVKGNKNVLIDAGVLPKSNLFLKGIAASLDEQQLDSLLLTHSHFDHVGCAHLLEKKFGLAIHCSAMAKEILQDSDMAEMIDLRNQELKDKLRDFSPSTFAPLKNLSAIGEGERIDIGEGRYFDAISVPGHSDCALGYLLQPDRILFAGDAAGMLDHNGYVWPVFFTRYGAYEKSLLKMADLDLEGLASGHSEFIDGKANIQKFFTDSIAEARRMKMEILGKLHRSMDHMDIAESIKEKRYIPKCVLGEGDELLTNIYALVRAVNNEFNMNR